MTPTAQLLWAQSDLTAKAQAMRSTNGQAGQEAVSAQAFHIGESAAAFQAHSALSGAWQGDTGMTHQAWQTHWNQAMEQLEILFVPWHLSQ